MNTLTSRIMSVLLMALMVSPAVIADEDTVSMTPGYATDIYYNLETGVEMTSPREIWDIAFSTKVFSAAILINDGSGVELYTWGNGDTTGWANVDTNGMSTWGPLYNNPDDWEIGAFNQNSKDHPDYGWGIYNNFTHDVVGDSLYIIKRADGSLYKLWIKRKTYNAGVPVFIFKIAGLDGSNETTQTIDCTPYTTKNFIYYSIPANQIIDREPAATDWDILFTKYMAIHPTGTPYPVTGALSNYNLGVAEVTGVSQYLYNDFASHSFDSSRSVIGYDWKTFDMGTYTYIVDDSTIFFLKDPETGHVWKLFFETFEGSMTGNIVFHKFNMSVGIEEVIAGEQQMFLFPNPASGSSTLLTDLDEGDEAIAQIMDMSGRIVRELIVKGGVSEERTPVPLNDLKEGMYILRLHQGTEISTTKLIVR